MKLLLTSDTQTEFSNLDQCEQVLEELLVAAKKYQPDAIIHAGDVKEHYSPVDVRVPKFWVRATQRIVKAGFRFIVLKGNHDRISQSTESKDWLSILRAAGAETVSTPMLKKVGAGACFFLPFTPDKKQELTRARKLALWSTRFGASVPSVLILHTEVDGAQYDLSGRASDGISLSELSITSYDAAFAGHLHMHQRLGNLWYIGSPFCQDWGEANQRKGFLFANVEPGIPRVKFIPTKIPRWYDADWLEKHKVIPEPGAYIRSKIAVSSKKITQQLQEEEKRLVTKYGKTVRVFVAHVANPEQQINVQLTGATDREKVAQYVATSFPEQARFKERVAISYLTYKLAAMPAEAKGKAVRFLSVAGKNVLSFKAVKCRLHKQGFILLRGINHDWPGHSNGAGKTNFLSLLSVALFGETLKEQKHDSWVNERCSGEAEVRAKFRDHRGRVVEIIRTRPHSLKLLINGKDESTGMRSSGRQETQGLLEQILGYDLRTFRNAVTIDQNITNGFVFGTNKDRMDIVAKLQNLERFDAVQKLVSLDINTNEKAVYKEDQALDRFEEDVVGLEAELKEASSAINHDWQLRLDVLQKEILLLAKEHAALSTAKQYYVEKQEEADAVFHDQEETSFHLANAAASVAVCKSQIKHAQVLIKAGKCPECAQPSTKAGTSIAKLAKQELAVAEQRYAKYQKIYKTAGSLYTKLNEELQKYGERVKLVDRDLEWKRGELAEVEAAAKAEAERNKQLQSKKDSLALQFKQAQRYLTASRARQKALAIDGEMLQYAKKAFSRTGMPLYLCASLCPVLNKSAQEYSELFNGGKLSLVFAVRDAEFCCDIINSAGSGEAEGQSVGESAMAGVIAAFAVREISPKTNLLIMDEPGHGLDPTAAKLFAKGLLQLRARWGTCIITTHSPFIDAVLSGEKVWTIQKKKGRSRLLMD